jgi:hypothetical protein
LNWTLFINGLSRLAHDEELDVLNYARGGHLANAEDESYKKITAKMEDLLNG